MKIKQALLILFFITYTIQLFGQDLSFVNYSIKDGLSSSQVYDMFQDNNGDMFFATDRGITKYDGSRFEIFDKSDGLTNTTVFDFYPQSDGSIWCSTINNSWFYFQNGTTDFNACKINPNIQKYSKGALVEDLWVSNKGDIYIAFENKTNFLKLNYLTGEILYELNMVTPFYDTLQAVFIKKDNKDWFKYTQIKQGCDYNWSNRDTFMIEQSSVKMGYKKMAFINDYFLFTSNTYALISDVNNVQFEMKFNSEIIGVGRYDEKHFWISLMNGGIKIISMEGEEKQHWLNTHSVTDLFTDRQGGIWISTLANGIFYAQSDKIKYYETDKNQYVYSLSSGKNKFPLVTTFNGYYQYDGFRLKKIDLGHTEEVRKTFFDSENDQYIFRITSENFPDSFIEIIDFSENPNYPLTGSSLYGFFQENEKGFYFYVSPFRVTAIESSKSGFLIGGYNGLQFYNTINDSFSKVDYAPLNQRITDIKRKGEYHFIATNENGLIRYSEDDNEFIHITTANGLSSNLINEIYPETDSILWIATSLGLDRLSFKGNDFQIKHLGVEHGLKGNDITDVYVNKDIIWIGTRLGLCSIKKLDFETLTKSSSLNLYWTSLKLNNKESINLNNSSIDYDINKIEFEFHSTFYGGKNRVKYRYKLSEVNDTWIPVEGRTIVLNTLQHGNYKLILQGNVDNTNWTDNQTIIKFKILSPFYQTWWFRSLIIGFMILMIYVFFKFRVLIYNKSLVKEVLRLLIRKLKPQYNTFLILEQGNQFRINSENILYLKSEGNYLVVQLVDKKYTIRYKIGEFENLVPDKTEYLRVHKSFVIRIDKVTGKNNENFFINEIEIPIGKTYKKEVKGLSF